MSGGTFTCATCLCVFETVEAMKDHYRCEWHRFNLKRKVAALPPLTESEYAERRDVFESAQRERELATESGRRRQRKQEKLAARGPRVVAAGAAGAATAAATAAAPPSERELTEEELVERELAEIKARPRLTVCDSLFDNNRAESLEENVRYMLSKFSFTIPEIEYLAAPEELMQYLADKVALGYACIYCNKRFHGVEGVRHHMVSLSHCKMNFADGEHEYTDFYDYRKSYKKAAGAPSAVAAAAPNDNDDDEWDDAADGDDDDDDDGSEGEHELNGMRSAIRIAPHGYTMILADGRRVGHRELLVYYKQKLRQRDEKNERVIRSLMLEYGARGMRTTALTVVEAKRRATEQRRIWRHLKDDLKQQMQLGVRTNLLYIKRPQIQMW